MHDSFIEGVRVIELGDKSICHECQYKYVTPYSVVITNYETGYYDGSGIAFMKTKDGKWNWNSMSHCSCYGPWENGGQGLEYGSLKEMLESITDKYEFKKITEEMLKIAKSFE